MTTPPVQAPPPPIVPNADPVDPRPFGAQISRGNGPLVIWSVLYVAWLLFLVVMVWRYTGRT